MSDMEGVIAGGKWYPTRTYVLMDHFPKTGALGVVTVLLWLFLMVATWWMQDGERADWLNTALWMSGIAGAALIGKRLSSKADVIEAEARTFSMVPPVVETPAATAARARTGEHPTRARDVPRVDPAHPPADVHLDEFDEERGK